MDLHSAVGPLTRRSRSGASALTLMGEIAISTLAIAAPAQAHTSNLAKAWGLNTSGQLGDGTETGPEKCGPPGRESACSTTPVAVSNLSGIIALAGGPATESFFSLALVE